MTRAVPKIFCASCVRSCLDAKKAGAARRPGPASLALDHAVAHADLGDDVLGIGRLALDLAADVAHVHAQDLRVARRIRPPDALDHEIVRQHAARVAAQQRDDLVLVLRQVHGLAVHLHHAPRQVDLQPAGLERLPPRGARRALPVAPAAQRRPHPRQQLLRAEGLGHVVVRAAIQRHDLVLLVPARRHDHDRPLRPAAQAADQLLPVAVGQPQIQQDQVRVVLGGHAQRVVPICRLQHVVAAGGQHGLQIMADARIVLHDQNPHRVVLPSGLLPSVSSIITCPRPQAYKNFIKLAFPTCPTPDGPL